MGGEAKTETSDEFKSLEQEMDLRQNGELPPVLERSGIEIDELMGLGI